MTSLEMIGFCGVDCSVCSDYISEICPGCRKSAGTSSEECPLVTCCLENNSLVCGQCRKFPCDNICGFFEESESHMEAKNRNEEIMAELRFRPGDKVQHFKRETLDQEDLDKGVYLYEIVGFAVHSETREDLMVYRALYGDRRLFVRPLEMFLEEVDREKYPDIRQRYRFELFKK